MLVYQWKYGENKKLLGLRDIVWPERRIYLNLWKLLFLQLALEIERLYVKVPPHPAGRCASPPTCQVLFLLIQQGKHSFFSMAGLLRTLGLCVAF
jgi:hypothetical protein